MTRSFSLLAQLAAEGRLTEVKPMSAPAIRGLAATIRSATQSFHDSAGKLAALVQAEADGFAQDVQDVTAQIGDVKSARADLRAALGLGGNGGPPISDPTPAPASGQAPAPSAPSPSASEVGLAAVEGALQPGVDRTAIGPVQR